jgi:hypothetical protein
MKREHSWQDFCDVPTLGDGSLGVFQILGTLLWGRHYYEVHPNSLWVSLDFEWIWTFLPSEIV